MNFIINFLLTILTSSKPDNPNWFKEGFDYDSYIQALHIIIIVLVIIVIILGYTIFVEHKEEKNNKYYK